MQFAGSQSTGDRRRRRIVVSGNGTDVDPSLLDGDLSSIQSQLVLSAAAGPWVPVFESRIWIYGSVLLTFLCGLSFLIARPDLIRVTSDSPAGSLIAGPRPGLLVFVQTTLLALSTQLGLLINWYRSRCKLDFSGRYRVWPWVIGVLGCATLCTATNFHVVTGSSFGKPELLPWRGEVVFWLLPFCLVALPMTILIDRDLRKSRSSLLMLRLSGLLWLTAAWMEIFRAELQTRAWLPLAQNLIPLFASATLFLGLWLHARIVAYVCPDPPELEERSATAIIADLGRWTIRCLMFFTNYLMFWKRRSTESDSKTKRKRKKPDEDEATTKRKRKTPAKRATTRTRTRTKVVEEESVEDDSNDEDPADDGSSSDETTSGQSSNDDSNEYSDWEEEATKPTKVESSSVSRSASNGRFTKIDNAHSSPFNGPHSRKPSQQESYDESDNDSAEDEDDSYGNQPELTAEQMKGLSKRQKRELKRQLREQSRGR